MTPRERYRAVLGGGQPDIVPRLPILMQFAAEHIGSNYRAFASDYRVLVSAGLRCAEEFASTNSAPSRTLPRNGGLRRVARIPPQRRTDLSQAPARR